MPENKKQPPDVSRPQTAEEEMLERMINGENLYLIIGNFSLKPELDQTPKDT